MVPATLWQRGHRVGVPRSERIPGRRDMRQMGKADLSFEKPVKWSCPQCGLEYLTVELQPRCRLCGYREEGA